MKLCKLYANDENQFHNIEFNEGFNVIIAKITDKSKREKDTHGLGKSLLISVIDFLLLKSISNKNNFFLTKGGFEGLEFFAEFKLNNGHYLVIKRPINTPTKISFKLNTYKLTDFKTTIDWDEKDISFKKGKEKLNEYLGFTILPNWLYRKGITYFLRTQNDFRDVFKLDKFKSRDKDWKPFMFDLLGFDGQVILDKYDLEDDKKELEKRVTVLEQEADINIAERDFILGSLAIKTDEKTALETKIDRFNFYENDKAVNAELIEEIDNKIQLLNTKRYSLSVEIKKINRSLAATQNTININKLKNLYQQVEIYFPDDLVNDYDKLLAFNQSLTKERNEVLETTFKEAEQNLKAVDIELKELETEKENLLSYLTEKDSYAKFKHTQKQLAKAEAELITLGNKLKAIDIATKMTEEIEAIDKNITIQIKKIQNLIAQQKHAEIRKTFNHIIQQVLNTNALLSLKQNKSGNVEFEANIQNPKDFTLTAEDYGTTYRKLLCVAFDLSLLITYSNQSFYRFVYHDGVLEALDDRKKLNLLNLVKSLCQDYNLQYILTLIDSDLPKDENGRVINFSDNEICLTLHDKDDSGKLFKKSF